MKITIYPPIRDQFTMAAMANTMRERIIELHGSEDKARRAHDEWVSQHRPPVHKWTTYHAIARIEVYKGLSPSQVSQFSEKIEWEIK